MTSHTIPARRKALVIALLGALACAPFVQARSISIVPAESLAWGVSSNGQVVVGQLNGTTGAEAFLWTSLTGMVGLGVLPGGVNSYAYAASTNGHVIVGASERGAFNAPEAFYWTAGGGMHGLGFLPGGQVSEARGVSANGQVIVGFGDNLAAQTEAWQWTATSGMAGLGFLAGGTMSRASAVSADGTVIVGVGDNAVGQTEAIRWVAGNATGLGFLSGGHYSDARSVSAYGTHVVGLGINGSAQIEAFLWNPSDGMQGLGFLQGGANSQAYAVNADGTVVVGTANDAQGNNIAFRWTPLGAMQSVEDWLSSAGTGAGGWHLYEASGVSADGSVIVGQGEDPQGAYRAYIARVTPDGVTGVIDPVAWSGTLRGARAGFSAAQSQQAMPIEGAHHRTLLSYGNNGRRYGVWFTGDFSKRSEGEGGHTALGEVGGFADLNPALRLGLAFARDTAEQRLDFGGRSRLEGHYVLAEAGWRPVGKPWQLSFTALSGRWDADTDRAYPNGGGVEVSSGRSPVEGHSMRLRLDVPAAWHWGAAPISPYVAYAEKFTRMAAYTEVGGAFPAQFNAQKDTAREGVLGLRVSQSLSPEVAVHGHFEWVHRLDHYGAGLSGSEASGLLPFSFSGAKIQRNGLRAALDFDYRIATDTLLTAALVTSLYGDEFTVTGSLGLRWSFD